MSEANLPENSQGRPESSPTNWYSDWDTFFNTPTSAPQPSREQPALAVDATEDWQTVDFPNAISADAVQRQGIYASPSPEDSARSATQKDAQKNVQKDAPWAARTITPNPSTADVWAENLQSETAQPDLPQLLSLIQELNQCNNTLLDRVSQLEEVLEMTQKALKEERERSTQLSNDENQELLATRQQLSSLFNELELAHQTSQRQQLVVEALTEQLTASQEQVARLERDCAIAHQHATEQAALFNQSELTCRDLRVRLQRQQRYTLQFKAALEQCLEVTTPPFDGQMVQPMVEVQPLVDPLVAMAVQPLVPKVRQIQPWSSQKSVAGLPIKIDSLVGYSINSNEAVDAEQSPEIRTVEAIAPQENAIVQPALPPVETATALPSAAPELTEVALGSDSPEFASVVEEAIQKLNLTNLANLGNAGEELWEHLAKLVDLSADDLIKASQAETFSDFAGGQPEVETADEWSAIASEETTPTSKPINPFEANPSSQSVAPLRKLIDMPFEKASAPEEPVPVARPAASAPAPLAASAAADQPEQSATAEGFVPGRNWPAPVVYPFRPTKKLASLAAVELPTFPRS